MAIRHHQYKLVAIKNRDTIPPELFDLTDIDELTNVKDQHPGSYDSLLLEWEQWNRQLKDRVFPTLSTDVWWSNY